MQPRIKVSTSASRSGCRYSSAIRRVLGWSIQPSSTSGTKRGHAAEVTLIENLPAAAQALRAALLKLQDPGGIPGLHLVESDALAWLKLREPQSLDIVFVDPPFGQGLQARALALLGDRDLVRAGGIVYVETARAQSLAPPGLGWDILRDKTLGEVRMVLLQKI